MDARRSARVSTPFYVTVEGLEPTPVLRHGDISATGMQLATDVDLGGVGTVQWLCVTSVDRQRTVHVMSYVVRTVAMLDATNRRVHQVALEFMPESETTVQVLQELVRYVLALRADGGRELELAARVPAHVEGKDDEAASVQTLTVRSVVLETSWAVPMGERVIVDITAPGRTRRIRLEGRATRVEARSHQRFDVEVEVQREMERPYRGTGPTLETDPPPAPAPPAQLEELLAALIEPTEIPVRGAREHLSGLISRIRLPTLCSLFDIDRMSGKLVVQHLDDEATLWVKEGQIIDIEPLAEGDTARARIGDVLAWEDGSFDFTLEPVDRPDVVRLRTTALLLDMARVADEASRDAADA